MLFPEEDAPELKTWIVKRIENTSDADSDVLADYVIALLKHDGDKESVRKLCEQEIPDFLTEDSKAFLDDVFRVIEYRSYKPGAPPPPAPNAHLPDPMINSRKRVRYDDLDTEDHDMSGGNGRALKQPRRGGRQQQQNVQLPPGMPAFDPNNPMEAFMRMQAMGMGMPEQFGQKPKRRGRCRDFDTKGFCSRGSTCMYDHGTESAWVPPFGAQGEYDPEDAMKNMPMFNPMMAYNFPADNRGRNRRGRGRKGNNRANMSAEGPNQDRSKTTIVIENIPPENLNEDSVREFFTPFGPISEISIKTNKRLAVIKYETWDAANAAYQSPKVIFDNRFVKVFWAKDETPRQPVEPEIDHEEFERRQQEAQKQHLEREAKRLEIEQQRQELEEKQQTLLAKHREQLEELRAKMSGTNGNATPTEEESTTDALRKKLLALEDEARFLGINPEDESAPARGGYRGRGRGRGRGYAPRGRGSFRGTARHATYAQYSIDNRPKKVAISGADFTASDKDEALRHFLLNTGEFESIDAAADVTHVSFKDRKTAEKFYYTLHGKELPGVEGQLDLAWVAADKTDVTPVEKGASAEEGNAMAGMDEERERERERDKREVDMDYEMPDEEVY